jgi:hypothetical protein
VPVGSEDLETQRHSRKERDGELLRDIACLAHRLPNCLPEALYGFEIPVKRVKNVAGVPLARQSANLPGAPLAMSRRQVVRRGRSSARRFCVRGISVATVRPYVRALATPLRRICLVGVVQPIQALGVGRCDADAVRSPANAGHGTRRPRRSAVVCATTRLDGRHDDHAGLLVQADDGSPVADA